MTYEDGRSYAGEFQAGKMHGLGIMKAKDGSIIFEGIIHSHTAFHIYFV
jgi:hypothetical protein